MVRGRLDELKEPGGQARRREPGEVTVAVIAALIILLVFVVVAAVS